MIDRSEAEREVPRWARGVLVVALLYLFLVGVSLLEAGIKGLGSDIQASLFDSVSNPLAGLFVGVLGTVLVQSSSVSTSTIVGMVASGIVGVDDAVYMVMGANIGTSVTNTLASLGNVRRPQEFRRGFAAATVHDFFNLLCVAVLMPLQYVTGFLSEAATWLSEQLVGAEGAEFESPIKAWVKEPVGRIEDLLDAVGLSGNALGVALIVIGLVCIFLALAFITRNMKALVAERVERSLNELLGRSGGLLALLFGVIATVAVQSSSITTSTMVPLAAAGVLTLQNIYPVTLGANLGTTITALLAALGTGSPAALSVALAHTLFNLTGILVFYPVPQLRRIPIRLAEALAEQAVHRRSLVVLYVGGMFVVVPLVGMLILR